LITDGNFEVYADFSFIPSKCRWFEIANFGSYQAYQELDILPGERDITFNLELVQNPILNCNSQFNFYSEFDYDAFDLKFVIDNEDDEYMIKTPEYDWIPVFEDSTDD
jgi:hypothetical protein